MEEVLYCEWCGEFPYYISIYEEADSKNETLICKDCFINQLDDEGSNLN